MDKEFAEEFELELTEGKVEELGKQIAVIAGKFKGKEDVMTMADEMITNGTMPDPEMIKMLETEEADMIRHLIAKKMGIKIEDVIQKLQASLISPVDAIMILNPDLDEQAARQELIRIKRERAEFM